MTSSPAASPLSSTAPTRRYPGALALLTVLFFMWGFITVLNDILIPHLKGLFSLNTFQAMLVQSAFFGAYFICSMPAGRLVRVVGYQYGIVVGLAVTGLGAALFYPASIVQAYPLFLASLFVLATGITVLQVAANPYVTILGPPETGPSRLNLTQGLNSLGTTVGPWFGATLIFVEETAPPEVKAQSVQLPYLGLAGTLVLLAVIFAVVRLPTVSTTTETAGSKNFAITDHPALLLGIGAIFFYVGAEVFIGSTMVEYLQRPDIAGLTEKQAGYMLMFYWGGAMVGRFLGSAIQQVVRAYWVLAFNALLATVLVLLAVAVGGSVGMYSLIAVGLANSIMFPTIFALSIEGLGENTSKGASYLVMAIVGGAVVPAVAGKVVDLAGISAGIATAALCYGYIAFFAVSVGRQKA